MALGLGAGAVGLVVALSAGQSPVATAGSARGETTSIEAPLPGDSDSTTLLAREVLREWDRRREAAWAEADEDALAALYLPDAAAGRRDVELLRRWTARGARITRLQPQVLALRVVRDAHRRLIVRVTDRLGVIEARVEGDRVKLPHDQPTTRRIEFRRGPRVTSRWRVASVRGVSALGGPESLVR